ncbi:MAG: S8/S53 family peptidase [Alcanivoracaceae bacterium]|nr:S8/S53 family peptidase [Alcanivoracaceae bacterium]
MKFNKNILILLLFNAVAAFAAPLNFECDITPAPLKIDCPNDEFHSLGFYPPDDPNYSGNPEDYINNYQWGSDYMNFAYGWYYTLGTARLGVLDDTPNLHINELTKNYRSHSSGQFGFTDNDFKSLSNTFTPNFSFANTSNHGSLVLSLLTSPDNDTIGMSGLCRNCSLAFTLATGTDKVKVIESNFISPTNPEPVSMPANNCNYVPSLASSPIILTGSRKLEDYGYKCGQEALNRELSSVGGAIGYLIKSGNQVINISSQFSERIGLQRSNPDKKNLLYMIDDDNDPKTPLVPFNQPLSFPLWDIKSPNSQRDVYVNCASQINVYGFELSLCTTLATAKARDIIIVASAGNNLKTDMAWPASEFSNVIGVAGTDQFGRLWDRRLLGSSSNCPLTGTEECGTNFDAQNTLFAAPAHNTLLFFPFGNYNASFDCEDSNFGSSVDGYQLCSGTSFSAPYVTSVVAMIRSINPLISFENVKLVLWDSRVQNLADQRYAIPKANKSVKITLGKSNGAQLVNRLTTMFRMKTNVSSGWPGQISYLSTTIPQVASAAKLGSYLSTPGLNDFVTYKSDYNSPDIDGYPLIAGTSESARAPFFVFGSHRNPFNNDTADLLPLHHLVRPRFSGNNGVCSELADHAYSTNEINGFLYSHDFCSQYIINYLDEGIDGYILPSCPNGVNCYENTGNANDVQCLKLRYSTQDNSFALMMASEVNEPMFASYGTSYTNNSNGMSPINTLSGMSNAECLGYVFPNVDSDSDGVIDGMELVLNTDPNIADSDGDGVNDGDEYPLAGIPQSDPTDPLDFVCSSYSCQ